jgi:hypothetical protein
MQEVPAAQDMQLPETCANAAANEDDEDDTVFPVSKACCLTGQHMPVLLTVTIFNMTNIAHSNMHAVKLGM